MNLQSTKALHSVSTYQNNGWIVLKRILFVVLLIQCGNVYANLPVIKFRHLTVEDGLSHSWIRCIYRDSYGYMWFGTGSNGLNKYDGSNFTIYENDPKNKNSISSNNISFIYEDKKKNLWIGTQKGLNVYNRELDYFSPTLDIFNNTYFTNIFELANEKFLLISFEAIFLFDSKNNSVINLVGEDQNNSIAFQRNTIFQYKNKLLIGTNKGVFSFDTTSYKLSPVYTNIEIRSMLIDNNDRIWIGAQSKGLFCLTFKNNDFSKPVIKHFINNPDDINSISKGPITALDIDDNNNLWIGTLNTGLNILNLNNINGDNIVFQHYRNNPSDNFSFSDETVEAIYIDNEETVWIGTYTGGISYYSKWLFKFRHVVKSDESNKNSINDNKVNVIYKEDNYLWVGTRKGLNVQNLQTKKWERYEHDNNNKSLGGEAVWAIFRDSRKNMWIGTWDGGLNLFNETTKTFTRFLHDPNDKSSISNNNVFDIKEDKEGIIWIATMGGGLNRFNPKTNSFKSYNIDYVKALRITNNNEIYLVTSDGLHIFNKEKEGFLRLVSNLDDKKSISSDNVVAVLEDSKGNIWLGTDNGLNLFNRDSLNFVLYNKTDGLPNNVIRAICEDDHGNLWISTNKGLSKFINGINCPESPVFENYDTDDGLQSNEFNSRACFKDKDGRLYFGGLNGFNVFHPDSIKKNPNLPGVVFTNLMIFNKPVEIGKEGSPLSKHFSLKKKLTFKHYQSVITIEYAAFNYLAPDKTQYAYIMEGFEEEWNYVGNQKLATYTNLDPGKYIFRVKASNNDGIWNEEGTSLKITITPPFWQTAWFRISIILFIFSIAYVTHLFRVRSIVAYGRRLEIEVAERTKELDYANKELEESANKLKTIVNAVSEGFAIVDKNHVILEANEFLLKLFGLKREEVINKKCRQIFSPWEETCKDCPLGKIFKEKRGSSVIEKTKISKNGTIRYFNIQCYAIPNHRKESPKSVISIRDITERKNMEKKRIQNYKRKMKNLSHELTLAEEHERKRIATTLHAEIGQILAFLKLKIAEVKEKESSLNTEGELEEIYNLVQNAITSTRSLMSQISPSILYELGFIPAVDWLAENILQENNIKYTFKDDGKEKPLTDDLRILLFQAMRELLVNIRKHANAKKVKISIKRNGENIQIDIKDDGIGFDISTLDSYDEKDVGFGLLNIRNRIDVVGGYFEIESKKKKGTKIRLKVPMHI